MPGIVGFWVSPLLRGSGTYTKQAVEMDKPQLLLDRCVRGSSRWVECRICERSCPKGAIAIGEKPFHYSVSEECDVCGLCWTKCPAEAFLPPMAERLVGREELWVLCQRTSSDRAETPEDVGLRVPCVREIGFRFLTAGWLAGLSRARHPRR